MKTQTLVNLAPQPQANTPHTWDQPTPLAQVGDIIRQSFAPVMQVIEKDMLADGRVRLLVKPVSASCTEEWVVEPEPIVEQQLTPVPAADIEAAQPVGLAGDATSYQLQPDWEALAEYESGISHGQLDAANRMPPICTEASCPYSQGYLDAYHSFLAACQQPLPTPKLFNWSVVHDPKWDLYQVWIGERCLLQKAISYEEGEKIAQKYIAVEELLRRQNQAVLASYLG